MRHRFPTLFLLAPLAVVAVLAIGCGPEPEPEPTLYERLGERPAIEAVAHQFVLNLQADERVSHFFIKDDVDIEDFEGKLVDQLVTATGGPNVYTGKNMEEAHKDLHDEITNEHFDIVVENLVAALDQFNVPEKEKNELLSILGPMREAITGDPAP